MTGGDEAKRGGRGDSREPRPISRPRDMYEPDLHIDTLKVKARNFQWPVTYKSGDANLPRMTK
jgi:hypothetical protein